MRHTEYLITFLNSTKRTNIIYLLAGCLNFMFKNIVCLLSLTWWSLTSNLHHIILIKYTLHNFKRMEI